MRSPLYFTSNQVLSFLLVPCSLLGMSGSSLILTAPPAIAQAATSEAQKIEGDRLLEQGYQQYQRSQFRAAVQSFEQALTIYQAIGDRSGEERTLTGLGLIYRELGPYSQALDYHQQALIITREIGDRRSEGKVLNNIGLVYRSLGQYTQALDYYQQALTIRREVGDRSGEGTTLNNIGAAYSSLRQYSQALDYYQQALVINREIGDRSGEGTTLNNIGLAYNNLGQYLQALDYYQQALNISQIIGNRAGERVVLGNIGKIYDYLGQYSQALDSYQQALIITREIGDRLGEGDTLNDLGMTYRNLGQYAQALDYYQQALSISRNAGDRLGEGTTLSNMGVVYANSGQYLQALDYYQQALIIRREVGDSIGEGATLNNIGLTYHDLGQYAQALDYYQQAIATLRQLRGRDSRVAEGSTLNNFGLTYRYLGQYSQALDYYQQALAIFQELGNRAEEGTTFNNLGLVYRDLEQYPQALDYYQQALAISREIGNQAGEGTTLSNIGATYSALEQNSQALDYYQQALVIRQAVGDRAGEGVTLNNIGAAYTQLGQNAQALDYYQQALAIYRAVGDRSGEGVTLSNISYLLEVQEQPELAILFLKQSVNRWEAIRGELVTLPIEQQQTYADTVAHTYRRLADLLLQQDRILEAQRVLDLLKVQELDEYLQDVQRNAQTESGVVIRPPEEEILQLFEAQQNQLVALGQELAELTAIPVGDRTSAQTARITELRQLEQAARQQFRVFYESEPIVTLVEQLRQTTGAANLELAELNQLQNNLRNLDQNAVILYPLVLDDRLELVLVTANAPPIRRTAPVGRAELNRAIAQFRSALQSPTGEAIAPAQQLYDWLIRPLEADLAQADAQTIIYAPDGQLRYIPLAALHNGNQWLVEQFQVNNITATSLTNLTQEPPSGELNVLAAAFTQGRHEVLVGDRTLSFLGLDFAEPEINNLSTLIPQTVKRLNDQFNLALVLEMNDYNIVHLATHATFNPGPAENSFILFGNGDRATLTDIKDWNFPNVDLIVLSACETAVGDVPLGNGEEILGFGYLMQLAGANAAIASLWQVSDGGTQSLMTAFYTALEAGNAETEALRQAQIALITGNESLTGDQERTLLVGVEGGGRSPQTSQLSHPYYWAPFILIGNGL